MLALDQNNLYDFRLQTLSDVEQALSRALMQKEKMLGLNDAAITKMYTYFESLAQIMQTPPPGKAVRALQETALTFLDKDLIDVFLNNPTDVEMRNNLSIELVFVSAATNTLPMQISPYTEEELTEILKGKSELPYYDDLNFVYTLRQLFEANVAPTLFSLMIKGLPAVTNESNSLDVYYWSDAFILTILLHTIWRHFSLLSENDQQFLIQNYCYQSIVVGVPVRFYMADFAKRSSVKGMGEKALRLLRESLFTGKESVPSSTLMRNGKIMGELVKEFTEKTATEQINTLVQEKFIGDRYRGQDDSDFFSAWLREVLTTVSALKSGDILKA